ncbi:MULTISPECIES: RidA family protein [Microbacterium]|jgi:enamine deaminase RidA (YjgF/YER057c/UK114 family)|uniref:RidA family protein n=1 Tax=Microbacterium TaxID=33882 RepID=UPI0019C59332|nr:MULTISPECIES: RidA family protein [Microbacterium]MBD3758875.1 RidA family protein [Microbacterium sp.]MBZ6371868.1 RidA family protein [Microbacterium hominis]
MERTPINPSSWSLALGFNQAELIQGQARTLYCSGQTAMSPDGEPLHQGDMSLQLETAVDNLESVLRQAGMTLADVVRLNVYTTDIEALLPHYGVLAGRLAETQAAPATTMLEVSRLAIPGQLVELEATAVA